MSGALINSAEGLEMQEETEFYGFMFAFMVLYFISTTIVLLNQRTFRLGCLTLCGIISTIQTGAHVNCLQQSTRIVHLFAGTEGFCSSLSVFPKCASTEKGAKPECWSHRKTHQAIFDFRHRLTEQFSFP